jgi:hypothetical protein
MSELEILKQELEDLIQFIESREDAEYLYLVHEDQIRLLEHKINKLENAH